MPTTRAVSDRENLPECPWQPPDRRCQHSVRQDLRLCM